MAVGTGVKRGRRRREEGDGRADRVKRGDGVS